ncbi:MAG: tRNA preQ1(34) S-adenosylmethionine ribosyltransferase-isomerase QueA [Gemmatimonas sp.]|nr:tRNA preQ1(34) S-adenosylmethionine ribosyltransferase-isomerase QueA [Gemmatimonas sp.]
MPRTPSVTCSEPPASAPAFHYDLPARLVAQSPAPRRTGSRLMLVARDGSVRGEGIFADLPSHLRAGDLLVANDTRVLPARLRLRRASGGRVELLLERPLGDGRWLALAQPMRRLKDGERLRPEDGDGADPAGEIEVVGRDAGGGLVVRACGGDLADLAQRRGETPLPPYIRRGPDTAPELAALDRERYQTVYAAARGSVAAPTAGLHFDAALLARLREAGVGWATVTLHVGSGTFRAPDADDLAHRRLHAERFTLPAATDAAVRRCRREGGRVVAVGTTSLRVLETVRRLGLDRDGPDRRRAEPATGIVPAAFEGEAAREGEGWRVSGLTRLFAAPPDAIAAADGLITNFHLPGSSLLMLLAAFLGGADRWRPAYARAVDGDWRFYSYGDAMLVLPDAVAAPRDGR